MSSLSSGATVGDFKIVSVLGVGGMGEVYKAYDPALDRYIAVKILAPHLVGMEDLVQRFVQEAKAASALNHPNIVTIHETGRTGIPGPDGTRQTHYIAMELIEGETLRTKILDPAFTLRQKIDVLAQAADGLAKAHASGIVHRDLKPENVMVTPEGYVKVLDFGLAKLLDRNDQREATPDGATDVFSSTKPGVLMGTVGYMAPEQIENRATDHRADIFAFGCILYHVVARRNPFVTESAIDTMHNILHAQPQPLLELAPDAPPELEWIARRCLAKDPEERFQSMKDLSVELREIRRQSETIPPGSTPRASRPPSPGRRSRAPLIAAVVAAVLAVAAIALVMRRDAGPEPFESMKIRRIAGTTKSVTMALSPDGKYLVHAVDEGKGQSLWVRQIATASDVALVPLAEVHYVDCVVSPNGDYVYYVSADNATDLGSVRRVPLLGGGATQTILEDLHGRIAISRDGKWIAYSRQDRKLGETLLMVVKADGSERKTISARKLPDAWGAVTWAPDGKHLIASLGAFTEGFETRLVSVAIEDGAMRGIGPGWRMIESLACAGDGDWLVVNGKESVTTTRNQLWLVSRRDGARRRITNDLNDYEALSVAPDGRSLLTLQKTQSSKLWLVPGGDSARARLLAPASENIDGASGLTWTPDGKVVYASEGSDERDLWSVSPAGGEPTRLSDGHSDVLPAATADGRYIVFVSMRAGRPNLWRVNADGSAPVALTTGPHETSPSVSRDGKWVYFHTNRSGVRTVWRVPVDGGRPEQMTTTPSSWPSVSPDGKAFACSWWDPAQTRARIAIVPVGEAAPRNLLDIPVNYWPGANNHKTRWTPDGSALTFVHKEGGVADIWRQPVDGSAPEPVTRFSEGSDIFWFDWSFDGKDLACARGSITSHVVLIEMEEAGQRP
jgi:serine/threonine protein kinase/Tol biopolymer transport system component